MRGCYGGIGAGGVGIGGGIGFGHGTSSGGRAGGFGTELIVGLPRQDRPAWSRPGRSRKAAPLASYFGAPVPAGGADAAGPPSRRWSMT